MEKFYKKFKAGNSNKVLPVIFGGVDANGLKMVGMVL